MRLPSVKDDDEEFIAILLTIVAVYLLIQSAVLWSFFGWQSAAMGIAIAFVVLVFIAFVMVFVVRTPGRRGEGL